VFGGIEYQSSSACGVKDLLDIAPFGSSHKPGHTVDGNCGWLDGRRGAPPLLVTAADLKDPVGPSLHREPSFPWLDAL
jgi:hypothetical protein